MEKLVHDILTLKEAQNACILAHNYQPGDIQDIADFVGDSLELSNIVTHLPNPTIVFCGVSFMAETAKILSPEKTILLPEPTALCDLAESIHKEDLQQLKKQYPHASVVCYVNSSIETKALSDYCCTSANALKIVESIPADTIIFIPDQGLGSWIQEKSHKEIILYPGSCPIHFLLDPHEISRTWEHYPKAALITHPEANKAVRDMSTYVGGTGGMIQYAGETSFDTYLVATDIGMIHRLSKEYPTKRFILAAEKIECKDMKSISLQKIHYSLLHNYSPIEVDPSVAIAAKRAIQNMMDIQQK
ncbi:MAG: quinolinate synthase NadA [Caldisericia bacterium]|nr:quinolinate synthase NadA [Caldisericia bacterium]MDD4613922.1 quinolinate synthase NadA [Caldisericia bacterium]